MDICYETVYLIQIKIYFIDIFNETVYLIQINIYVTPAHLRVFMRQLRVA